MGDIVVKLPLPLVISLLYGMQMEDIKKFICQLMMVTIKLMI